MYSSTQYVCAYGCLLGLHCWLHKVKNYSSSSPDLVTWLIFWTFEWTNEILNNFIIILLILQPYSNTYSKVANPGNEFSRDLSVITKLHKQWRWYCFVWLQISKFLIIKPTARCMCPRGSLWRARCSAKHTYGHVRERSIRKHVCLSA